MKEVTKRFFNSLIERKDKSRKKHWKREEERKKKILFNGKMS